MRRVGGFLIGLLIWLGLAPTLATAEQISMPYHCRMDRGRLMVTSGSAQTYAIAGVRAEMAFTSCIGRREGGCRTYDVHSFDVRCGAETVPWLQIAAALAPHRLGRATVDDGRLNLHLEPRPRPASDCVLPIASNLLNGLMNNPGRFGCDGRLRVPTVGRSIIFPTGFAPLTEFGAKLVSVGSADKRSAESAATQPSATGLSPAVWQDDTGATPLATRNRPSEDEARWLTVVADTRPREPYATAAPVVHSGSHSVGGPASSWLLFGLLVVGGSLVGMAAARVPFVRTRYIRLEVQLRHWWRTGRRMKARDEQLPEAKAAREMELVAEVQLKHLEDRAARLSQAQPLRRVLMRESQRHRRRLDAACAVTPEGTEGWARHRNRVQSLLNDLVRLGDIVDGAARSLAATDTVLVTPANSREAYEVLGANPEVGDRVLKKLVEALRACWHPDLARDEPDRRHREDRIKQINVAWDIVSGKRVEG